MSWTDDRVALLKRLWGEGKTAAEIAKELGGVTRNAVIGKAHRLKLSNRVSPIQQNKKPVAKPVTEKKIKQPVLRDENRKTVPLMDLNARMCRWPIGDPQEENFGFCGDPSIAGLPYCAEHGKVAYQAATRNRIMKAEEFEEKAAPEAAEEQDVKQAARR
jgi:GcrA cell cycle regulator